MEHTTNEGQALLRIPEAAARLGVSRSTVYRLVATGQLSTVAVKTPRTEKTAGRARIPAASIAAYIEREQREATA